MSSSKQPAYHGTDDSDIELIDGNSDGSEMDHLQQVEGNYSRASLDYDDEGDSEDSLVVTAVKATERNHGSNELIEQSDIDQSRDEYDYHHDDMFKDGSRDVLGNHEYDDNNDMDIDLESLESGLLKRAAMLAETGGITVLRRESSEGGSEYGLSDSDDERHQIGAKRRRSGGSGLKDKDEKDVKKRRTSQRYFIVGDDAIKCYACGKPGHLSRDCPQEALTPCHLCGYPGHTYKACPYAVCPRCLEIDHTEAQCKARKKKIVKICLRCGIGEHDIADCGFNVKAEETWVENSKENKPNTINGVIEGLELKGGEEISDEGKDKVMEGDSGRDQLVKDKKGKDGKKEKKTKSTQETGNKLNAAKLLRCIVCGVRGHINCAVIAGSDKSVAQCVNCGSTTHTYEACGSAKFDAAAYDLADLQSREGERESRGWDRSPIICHRCQQSGHIAKNCPNSNSYRGNNSNHVDRYNGGYTHETCHVCKQVGHFARDCPNNSALQYERPGRRISNSWDRDKERDRDHYSSRDDHSRERYSKGRDKDRRGSRGSFGGNSQSDNRRYSGGKHSGNRPPSRDKGRW